MDLDIQLLATIIKIAVVVGFCLQIPPIMIWVERRGPALMQRRIGPNRVGLFKFRLFGLMQSAADALKLMFKEEIFPQGAHKVFFHLAPVFFIVPAFVIVGAIPFGPPMQIGDAIIPLSIIDVDVGFLFIFAISSIGVYGITMAGWSSNNKFSLLGAIRACAQMISYEIPLGLSLIPIVMIYNTLDLTEIVNGQDKIWGVFLAPVSFLIFLICMFAETNRAPFDLAEGESELVAGFHTEFGTMKFAAFFFAEYVVMFVLSCFAAVVFFGGWQIPFVSQETLLGLTGSSILTSIIGIMVVLVKASFFMWLYVWVRWTLPRFRYDQLMNLGWKFMLPVGLGNVVITAATIAYLQN
jgi:NADH-quinone oxidoreductase subunit H